jgi:hypothetical protein
MNIDRPYCRALYDFRLCILLITVILNLNYRSEYPGELNFSADELIYINKKINDEWISGESQITGQKGIFPISFVEIILPNEKEVFYSYCYFY